jgi:hypothetical protein
MNARNLIKHPLMMNYYCSNQYKMNSWTLDQCKAYGKDFEKEYYNKVFSGCTADYPFVWKLICR